MNYSEDFYRLAIQHQEGYGPSTIKKMLSWTGNATRIFEEPDSWRSHIRSPKRTIHPPTVTNALRRLVDEELKNMDRADIRLCFYTDRDFPYRLKQCSDSPLSFFYQGNGDFNMPHVMAIVGTRNATDYGRQCVGKILAELQGTDVVTVSGLAYGIDTEAHQKSVENSLRTIAILGSGLGVIYPYQNRELARRILENGGTLISEYTYSTPPDRLNFPKRNRIIAGLSDATLVVESGEKGGSIITAYIAQSYNRDVLAVPGTIHSETHSGCHTLIRKNVAALVTSGADILELMNWQAQRSNVQTQLFVELSEKEQEIVSIIREHNRLSVDKISELLPNHTPSQLAGLLLELELKGVIYCKPGKIYSIQP
ncbi:MAG: DNA-processing protein DprA [Bacteroidales bacterium]|nr:DNA-processing protein DprA [Bacteroidales bacterium]MBR5922010.1 DNA-processing protein DprA [Bacteroidales bacterium]